MSGRRTRPRYGRLLMAGTSAVVTGVAVLGGVGLIDPQSTSASAAGAALASAHHNPSSSVEEPPAEEPPAEEPVIVGGAGRTTSAEPDSSRPDDSPEQTTAPQRPASDIALPANSGAGRRVVFSERRQRVWLVAKAGRVRSTYLVSGSIYDNLEPGAFEVYSRSKSAIGIDDSGTMKFFVRFTQGDTGAAIGFHDIPVDDGRRLQTFNELGTPQSHGCIRQRRSDARRLWEFAPIGTRVVVTA